MTKVSINKIKVDVILAKRQITVKELCEKSNFSRNRFYTILNSKRVTPKTAGKFAEALGVDVTEILED